ncbi:MAG TPA: hypothetical protein VFH76_01300 [Kribbella sp.]|nr:hypothetical protein [Kribbella sp.]
MPERETRQEAAERELLAVREEVRQLAENMRARLADDDPAGSTYVGPDGVVLSQHDAGGGVSEGAGSGEELEVRRVAWRSDEEWGGPDPRDDGRS